MLWPDYGRIMAGLVPDSARLVRDYSLRTPKSYVTPYKTPEREGLSVRSGCISAAGAERIAIVQYTSATYSGLCAGATRDYMSGACVSQRRRSQPPKGLLAVAGEVCGIRV